MTGRTSRVTLASQRLRRRLFWTAALVLMCLGGAGLASAVDRPATQEARPELSWNTDRAAEPWFQDMLVALRVLDADVAALSGATRRVLIDLNRPEAVDLEPSLAGGDGLVDDLVETLSTALAVRETPPAAVETWRLGEANLERLGLIDRALVSTGTLPATWHDVAAHARRAGELMAVLRGHDEAALEGIRAGSEARWEDAVAQLQAALSELERAAELHAGLPPDPAHGTLQDLLGANQIHDEALLDLYRHMAAGGSLEDAEATELRSRVEQARRPLPTPQRLMQALLAEIGGAAVGEGLSAVEEVRGNVLVALDEGEDEEG